ncbi:hypothetical protein [Flavobacterium silvaticum]|uniref:DUF2306 domain-containing protein n=1 Tax=Flavobacterium silvaticum TaxID=1852020 RepID=A0A972FYL7_9FLAO|nr:hypothetical protein [Flavobacterium silvaticum]NMH27231.1 hypothetical protein [Flavobacterium silvaticum]
MEKRQKVLIAFFCVLAAITLSGFLKSYLFFYPDFGKFRSLIHIHFAAFTCWLLLIVAQPVLIRKKNFRLHRLLGKASYFLAPILVLTIILLTRQKVLREFPVSKDEAIVDALIGCLDALSFSGYYVAAMVNRRNIRRHVAFIIAASLIVLNPGLGRLLNLIQPGLGMLGAVLTPFVVSIVILVYEKLKFKRPVLKSPYFIFLVCWIFEIAILIVFPQTDFWKSLVSQSMNN